MKRNKRQGNTQGLILIQIDGLAGFHLKQALQSGRMPFLAKLLNSGHLRLHSLYSGMPSTTPAVQGELFYGIRSSVPAFSFRDHESKKIMRLYEPHAAIKIEERLQRQSNGLLRGGSSYADIFSGMADKSHFCPVSLGKKPFCEGIRPAKILAVIFDYSKIGIKSFFLLAIETALAAADFFHGILSGKNIFKELKFIASRIAVSILLRDLVKTSAVVDIQNDLPVIHLNFLGYDEHAHRRGPSSRFAYWTLKGIDSAVKEIWNARQKSKTRAYDIWLYSDHGQEDTQPYARQCANGFEETVKAVLTDHAKGQPATDMCADPQGIQSLRSYLLGGRFFQKLFVQWIPFQTEDDNPTITAMGPLGYIYLPNAPDLEKKKRLARLLVKNAGIPLVLIAAAAGRAIAWNPSGEFILPDHAAEILGSDHPYREAVTEDLIRLCRHPDAGTFMISGWRPHKKPISFQIERGAHGGPGIRETDAFALLPPKIKLAARKRNYLWISDLREAAINFLHASQSE
jgi:hypothetical protein